MGSEKLAIALRFGIFSPQEIRFAAKVADNRENLAAIFLPDGRSGYEAIEMASWILAETRRVYAGSGVIRLPEHDPLLLARRVQTIQGFDSNRLILGVGTGTPGPDPRRSVRETLQKLDELNKIFQSFPQGVEPPEIYIATLKTGIAKRAARLADGLLMNFCSPKHTSNIIKAAKPQTISAIEFACYLKIFYSSKNSEMAYRLMIQEFLNYDSIPQYHQMFTQDGTAEAIAMFRQRDDWKRGPVDVPKVLLTVSLANPRDDELDQYVRSFRDAGVTLPVLYPYFPDHEKPEFKLSTLENLMRA